MSADPNALAKVPQVYFDAWNGRDNHALDNFFAPTFTWVDPLLPPEGITSIEGAQGFMTATWTGMPDGKFDLIGGPMIDEANSRVSQEWRFTGTLTGEFNGIPPTNKTTVCSGIDVYSVNDAGQVTAMSANYDSATLLRGLGLG